MLEKGTERLEKDFNLKHILKSIRNMKYNIDLFKEKFELKYDKMFLEEDKNIFMEISDSEDDEEGKDLLKNFKSDENSV